MFNKTHICNWHVDMGFVCMFHMTYSSRWNVVIKKTLPLENQQQTNKTETNKPSIHTSYIDA